MARTRSIAPAALLVFIALHFFWAAPRVSAQTAAPAKIEVSAGGGGVSSGDIKGGAAGGEVMVGQVSTGISYRAERFQLSLGYELRDYSWDGVDRLPFGDGRADPWDRFHRLSLGARHSGQIDGQWGYFLGGSLTASFEEEISGSLGGGVQAGLSYTPAPPWEMRLGAAISFHEVETSVLPLVGLSWNQQAESGPSFSLGVPQTELRYRFNPQAALSARFSFEGGISRLKDDSPVEREGYVEERDLRGGLYLELSPAPNIHLTLGGRYHFEREFNIYNKSGKNKRSYDVDDALGGVFLVKIEF